ncbi:hypothetical protein [Methylocapsa aurea]|uniref:hypothetical protein n=1 Tax=Methylocapsa aurea TaxID=663610 RepID=UPI0012EC6E9E|nr:hypothetical protein [Methylocapsa aurea]
MSKRVAISVISLYALLLQGFLAAAAQAEARDSYGEITCAPSSLGSESPNGGEPHQHCLCCVLGCAVAGGAYVATPPEAADFPARKVSAIVWTPFSGIAAQSPQKFYFAARAPPLGL